MSVSGQSSRPIAFCMQCSKSYQFLTISTKRIARPFSITTAADVEVQTPNGPATLDPATVSLPRLERKLIRESGKYPIGSRRRRAALQSSENIPFEQLPYQCFQEARKVLQADREEKIEQIEVQRERIARLRQQDPAVSGGEERKQNRLDSMQRYLEQLKIFADINDPLVKKKFEDGQGDMNKPIYRYLANRKWRAQKRLIQMQRITQMHIVPDVLPAIDPSVDVNISYGKTTIQPGEFIDSAVSVIPPKLHAQVFDKGERLVTVVLVDSDVPNLAEDKFDYRCHFIAANVLLSPTINYIALDKLSDDKVVIPWLPPYAQKGSPYHRLSLFLLQQPEGVQLDVAAQQARTKRDNFKLRSYIDKYLLHPIGVTLFRTQWDENMAKVMRDAGLEGSGIELKRERVQPLPYKKKDGARYR